MKTTSEKLNQLADFLEKLPNERFNYQTWGNFDGPKLEQCKTVACAAGWLDVASEGQCRAWYPDRDGAVRFHAKSAADYLGLDPELKSRASDYTPPCTDFLRLFTDADCKLTKKYGPDWGIPKHAVIARIRACAKSYAKRGR